VFLASWAGQPRPFWALMTAYVVANPLAGAVRSKGLFRFIGTLIGGAAAVLLVPRFANAPELLSLALALWVAGCLCLSLRDRTPRAYAFMLAGYTAALIGFPSVDTPLAIFDTAVARLEEIGLGVLAATLVHSLVLPKSLSSSVLGLLDRTLGDTRAWLTDIAGRRDGGAEGARIDDAALAVQHLGSELNVGRRLSGDRDLEAADVEQQLVVAGDALQRPADGAERGRILEGLHELHLQKLRYRVAPLGVGQRGADAC